MSKIFWGCGLNMLWNPKKWFSIWIIWSFLKSIFNLLNLSRSHNFCVNQELIHPFNLNHPILCRSTDSFHFSSIFWYSVMVSAPGYQDQVLNITNIHTKKTTLNNLTSPLRWQLASEILPFKVIVDKSSWSKGVDSLPQTLIFKYLYLWNTMS